VILTVEEQEARCAGLAAPIHADAFSSERLAVCSFSPTEWVPCTISASISFLRRARNTVFVLPTREQAESWEKCILDPGEERAAERVRRFAAVSLIGGVNTFVVTCY
jgi:hypothetical protein